jgi:hypothetical protein
MLILCSGTNLFVELVNSCQQWQRLGWKFLVLFCGIIFWSNVTHLPSSSGSARLINLVMYSVLTGK